MTITLVCRRKIEDSSGFGISFSLPQEENQEVLVMETATELTNKKDWKPSSYVSLQLENQPKEIANQFEVGKQYLMDLRG